MKEHFKTILLAGLIILSLYLTYSLWFGSPYLEEGVQPRYEFTYFTPPPTPELLIMPASILLQRQEPEEETLHLFRRGDGVHGRIWEMSYELLKRRLPGSIAESPGEDELAALLGDTSFKLLLRFNPPLPESFLWDRAGLPAELHTITFFFSEEAYYAILDGKEKELYRWFDWGESGLKELILSLEPGNGIIAEKLSSNFILQIPHPETGSVSPVIILPPQEGEEEELEDGNNDLPLDGEVTPEDILDETSEDNGPSSDETLSPADASPGEEPAVEDGVDSDNRGGEEDQIQEEQEEINGEEAEKKEEHAIAIENDDVEAEKEGLDEDIMDEEIVEEPEPLEEWKINVRGQIYVPVGATAAELAVAKEELSETKLVSAFFLDPAMARRIEERDGAIYFTDGKRGLRLYADGTVEYSAPGLEVTTGRLPYSVALLETAESQSLYGGWPAGVFLDRREQTAGGYRFFWRSYYKGFPLITNESSCEMVINNKGMPYYRRSFYIVTDLLGKPDTGHHYKDVLYRALELRREAFPNQEATLLNLEPVFRVIPAELGTRAVPAWAVHFAETGRFFLHWQTLEPIEE